MPLKVGHSLLCIPIKWEDELTNVSPSFTKKHLIQLLCYIRKRGDFWIGGCDSQAWLHFFLVIGQISLQNVICIIQFFVGERRLSPSLRFIHFSAGCVHMCLVIGNQTWIKNLRIKTLHLNRLADRCFHSGPELYQETDLVYPDDLLPRCCLLSLVDAVSAVYFESQLVLELMCWLDIGYSVLGSVCFIWSQTNSLEVYAVGINYIRFFSRILYPTLWCRMRGM